jgi:NADPH:quinone reductase-like Zn-dependent oxidoreductase
VAIGEGEYSQKFVVGDHVFRHTVTKDGDANDFNGLQQYALADARFVARVAETGLTDDEASTIPVIVLAGFIALFSKSGLGLPPPFLPEAGSLNLATSTLLVIGGGSNTGRATIELGHLAGIGRIIAVAGLHNEVDLKARGATHVIDRHAADLLQRIRAITGDDLIYAIDTVNVGHEQELGIAALSNSKRGTLITLRKAIEEFDSNYIGTKTMGYEHRFVMGVSIQHPEVTVGFWKEVPTWLKDGKIHPSNHTTVKGLDAEAVNKALDGYRDGQGVKVNVHPWE